MPVTDLMRYPVAEFSGWLAFYEEKARRDKVEKGDLMAMDDSEMVGQLKTMGLVG